MPVLQYGQTTIEWVFKLDTNLRRHYVTVERGRAVLLRGPEADLAQQEALVRKRARWIGEKWALVNQPQAHDPIVTGSRLRYAGRSFFTEVRNNPQLLVPILTFTASRFIVQTPQGISIEPDQLQPLLDDFYRERACEKFPARVRHWERKTGLKSNGIRIRLFQSRWASCDVHNVLEFHPKVMEFAGTVQDYIIIHELCHTLEKNHTKAFWALVNSHVPGWQRQHAVLEQAVFGDAF